MSYKLSDDNNNLIDGLTISKIIYLIKQNPNKKYFKIINNQEIEINNELIIFYIQKKRNNEIRSEGA